MAYAAIIISPCKQLNIQKHVIFHYLTKCLKPTADYPVNIVPLKLAVRAPSKCNFCTLSYSCSTNNNRNLTTRELCDNNEKYLCCNGILHRANNDSGQKRYPLSGCKNEDGTKQIAKMGEMAVLLPTDLSSRVLQLIPEKQLQLINCTYKENEGQRYFTPDSDHTDVGTTREVFRILQNSELNHINKMRDISSDNVHYMTSARKNKNDCEPADDPKEKIRLVHRKIKQQFPLYFNKGRNWHDFTMYTTAVQLLITPKNHKKTHVFRGLQSYKRTAWIFRNFFKLYLSKPSLDGLSSICLEDKGTIEIRWRVSGIPYHIGLIMYFFPIPKETFVRYYDYMSILFVNEDGNIWRHDVSKTRRAQQSILSNLLNLRKNIRAAAAITPFARKPTS